MAIYPGQVQTGFFTQFIVDVATGESREVFRADDGPGSRFQGIVGPLAVTGLLLTISIPMMERCTRGRRIGRS